MPSQPLGDHPVHISPVVPPAPFDFRGVLSIIERHRNEAIRSRFPYHGQSQGPVLPSAWQTHAAAITWVRCVRLKDTQLDDHSAD